MARGKNYKGLGKSITVNPDDVEAAIYETIDRYFSGIETEANRLVAETAVETVQDLEAHSPRDTGKYAKGWVIYQTARGKKNNEVEVVNKRYQLTHLLEYGHIKNVHGHILGFTDGHPHIRNAEQRAITKLLNGIRRAAEGK